MRPARPVARTLMVASAVGRRIERPALAVPARAGAVTAYVLARRTARHPHGGGDSGVHVSGGVERSPHPAVGDGELDRARVTSTTVANALGVTAGVFGWGGSAGVHADGRTHGVTVSVT